MTVEVGVADVDPRGDVLGRLEQAGVEQAGHAGAERVAGDEQLDGLGVAGGARGGGDRLDRVDDAHVRQRGERLGRVSGVVPQLERRGGGEEGVVEACRPFEVSGVVREGGGTDRSGRGRCRESLPRVQS